MAGAATITWNNASGGNWGASANWTPNQVPGAGDDAVIALDGTYTVIVNVNASVNSLTFGGTTGTQTLSISSNSLTLAAASTAGANTLVSLTGSAIAGAGNFTMNGQFNWDAGDMSGNGITTANGQVNLAGNGLQRLFSNRRFNTNGATAWSSANEIRVDNGGQIVNAGTWSVSNNQGINNVFGGGASFTNTATGIFRKTAGTGTSSISIGLTNDGLVDSQSGTVTSPARAPARETSPSPRRRT